MLGVLEFMNEDFWACDINESATGQAHDDWGDKYGCVFDANTDTDTCRLDERQEEEDEEDSFLRFGLVLAELHTQRDASNGVMDAHTDHQVDEGRQVLDHAQCDTLEDWVETEGKQKDQRRDVYSAHKNLFL